MAINRNAGATYFIPSDNEWYKAAYYDPSNASYWRYATQSNTAPINTLPDTGNHANFYDHYDTGNGGYTDPTNILTPVGAFSASPGPYGTYDQCGDVWQWDEGNSNNVMRVMREGRGSPMGLRTSTDWHPMNPTGPSYETRTSASA